MFIINQYKGGAGGGGGWWLYDQKGLGAHVPLCVAMFMTISQSCS
jgi:hypothetical protein